jgi:hypothetical protein
MQLLTGIMRKYLSFLLLVFVAGFTSCKTDFDINAEPEDITVAFGLLDQNDDAHYIKITRAFLGEEDALVMAQDPANSTYGDALSVTVEEYTNETLSRTFYCYDTLITDKEDGVFYYPNQEIYVFHGNLNVNSTYTLNIVNNETGKTVTAETGLVNDFTVEKPYYNPGNPQLSFVSNNGQYSSSVAKWKSAKNGRLYEPVFRFHYREVNLTTSDTTDKYIDWRLTSVKSSLLDGGENLETSYNSEAFYSYLEASIAADYNIYRIIGKIDFIMSVGGDDLSTYIDLNKPSSSIIQERPVYTNISKGGIGLFSCRHTKILTYSLSSFSVDKLINGEHTYQLNFH